MQVYSPSGHIDEEFVKYKALEFLQKRYRGGLFSANTVIAFPEVFTVEGKKADGLAFYKTTFSFFTASLEAKSYGTIYELRPQINNQAFHSRRQVFWAIGGSGYAYILILLDLDFIHAMVYWCLVILLGDYYFFQSNTKKEDYYSSIVFNQMDNYQANEKWLALAEDCFDNKMSPNELIKACQKARVGLLCVTSSGKVKLLLNPIKRHGNFISFYKDARVLEFL